jgi:aspartyl-tRNA(Asn)/glutamyl-tRNA(Gln) amidotransferase subunit A
MMSAVERARGAIARAEAQVPSAIEAVVHRAGEVAAASDEQRIAGQSRGPFDGMPFAVKANIDVAGEVTTSGLARPADGWWSAADEDADAVAALVAAGAVPVLTTTMAPMAMGSVTISPAHGPARSPLDSARHAGGSSGGSGAVVGAGAVRLALGSDTLGSVRIPAAYCGVTGWIPSPGLVSARGMVPLCRSLDRLGVLLADPRDLPMVIALLASTSGLTPTPLPSGPRTVARVDLPVDIDPAASAAVEAALATLATFTDTAVHSPRSLDI